MHAYIYIHKFSVNALVNQNPLSWGPTQRISSKSLEACWVSGSAAEMSKQKPLFYTIGLKLAQRRSYVHYKWILLLLSMVVSTSISTTIAGTTMGVSSNLGP